MRREFRETHQEARRVLVYLWMEVPEEGLPLPLEPADPRREPPSDRARPPTVVVMGERRSRSAVCGEVDAKRLLAPARINLPAKPGRLMARLRQPASGFLYTLTRTALER